MQTHTSKMRSPLRPLAAPGKHARCSARSDSPGKRARRILVTALLLGGLAVGSAATAEYATAPGHASVHHPSAVGSDGNVAWMY